MAEDDGEESMEDNCANEESEDEDLSEEELLEEHLLRDTLEEMTRELELMLWRAMNNGLEDPVMFQKRKLKMKRILLFTLILSCTLYLLILNQLNKSEEPKLESYGTQHIEVTILPPLEQATE